MCSVYSVPFSNVLFYPRFFSFWCVLLFILFCALLELYASLCSNTCLSCALSPDFCARGSPAFAYVQNTTPRDSWLALQCCTADASLKVPCAEIPGLSKVLLFEVWNGSVRWILPCMLHLLPGNLRFYALGSFELFFHVLFKYKVICAINSELDFDFWFDGLCLALVWPSQFSVCRISRINQSWLLFQWNQALDI